MSLELRNSLEDLVRSARSKGRQEARQQFVDMILTLMNDSKFAEMSNTDVVQHLIAAVQLEFEHDSKDNDV